MSGQTTQYNRKQTTAVQ